MINDRLPLRPLARNLAAWAETTLLFLHAALEESVR